MRRGRYICAATPDGTVHLLDPLNFSIVKIWPAHSAAITCLDTQDDFLITCGCSLRQDGSYSIDSFLNVFDVRKLSPLAPVPFSAGAAFARMHPKLLTTCIVNSVSGQMHVVDLMDAAASSVRQANVLSGLNMLEISPSGEAVALADADCNIHVWASSPSNVRFVEAAKPVRFAETEEAPPLIPWNEDLYVAKRDCSNRGPPTLACR